MARYTVTRRLPWTPQQLFDLVGDVERYPDFVPWVIAMRTWNPRVEPEGVTAVDAEASVAFKFLKESFSTRVRRNPAAKTIDVSLLSGPFKRLENRWRFTEDGKGTRIDFLIDFAFRVPFLDAILSANFDKAVDRLIGCFEARAATLYGAAGA